MLLTEAENDNFESGIQKGDQGIPAGQDARHDRQGLGTGRHHGG